MANNKKIKTHKNHKTQKPHKNQCVVFFLLMALDITILFIVICMYCVLCIIF